MTVKLSELNALYDKATKGEWRVGADSADRVLGPSREDLLSVFHGNEANRQLIVALHNAFPALAARLEALERVADRMRRMVAASECDCNGTHICGWPQAKAELSTLDAIKEAP